MKKSKHLLLVEGINDKSFFEEFCKRNGLDTQVTVAPPRDLDAQKNSKQAAINHLPLLLKQLQDGQLERLGLIVDADQIADGNGFDNTVKQVSNALAAEGFATPPKRLPKGGLAFTHPDGLPDFGLWVMPDNQNEGILEDWIGQSLHQDEQVLFDHARVTVQALKSPRFKPIRQRKAEIATWLAWQANPGEGLYYAFKDKLLEPGSALYLGLREWFDEIFQ